MNARRYRPMTANEQGAYRLGYATFKRGDAMHNERILPAAEFEAYVKGYWQAEADAGYPVRNAA